VPDDLTPEERRPDIDRLRAQHPLWAIALAWTARASGPDARQFTAQREGARVSAPTAAGLSAKIAAEEAARRWTS
jgi:hypothetical protein